MWYVSTLFLKVKRRDRKNIFLLDKRKKEKPGGLGGPEPLSEQATYLTWLRVPVGGLQPPPVLWGATPPQPPPQPRGGVPCIGKRGALLKPCDCNSLSSEFLGRFQEPTQFRDPVCERLSVLGPSVPEEGGEAGELAQLAQLAPAPQRPSRACQPSWTVQPERGLCNQSVRCATRPHADRLAQPVRREAVRGARSALPGPGSCNGRRGWMDPSRLSRACWRLTGGVGRAARARGVALTV